MNDSQQELLEQIVALSQQRELAHDEITAADYARFQKLSDTSARRRLRVLVDEGELTVMTVYDPRIKRNVKAFRRAHDA